MIIKDYFADGLLQIAIVLSLLRSDLDSFLDTSARPLLVRSYLSETNGGPLSGITRTDLNLQSRQVVREYPKVLDRYSDRFSTVLRDLHSLSYYRRFNGISTNVHAWLVNDGGPDGCSSSCEHSTGDAAAEADTTSHNISSPSIAEEISVLTPEHNDMNLLVEDELSKEVDYMLCLYDVTMSVCVCAWCCEKLRGSTRCGVRFPPRNPIKTCRCVCVCAFTFIQLQGRICARTWHTRPCGRRVGTRCVGVYSNTCVVDR